MTFLRSLQFRHAAILSGSAGLILSLSGLAGADRLAESAPQQNPFRADGSSISQGKAIYARHCAECHGAAGHGDGSAARDLDPAPTDLSNPDVTRKSDAELYRQITRGRRPMPSFRKLLADEERWHVINYIRTLGAHRGEGH